MQKRNRYSTQLSAIYFFAIYDIIIKQNFGIVKKLDVFYNFRLRQQTIMLLQYIIIRDYYVSSYTETTDQRKILQIQERGKDNYVRDEKSHTCCQLWHKC